MLVGLPNCRAMDDENSSRNTGPGLAGCTSTNAKLCPHLTRSTMRNAAAAETSLDASPPSD